VLKPKRYWFDYPLWAWRVRWGFRLKVVMEVLYDEDVNVYVATSKNIRGLVVEAASLDELKDETGRVVRDFMALAAPGKTLSLPIVIWPE
jgi:hypothetical protein